MHVIFFLRRNDFKVYISLTLIATLISIFSVYTLNSKFGKYQFSDYSFYSILLSIFFTVSDLGFKISYFKYGQSNKKSNYKYLILSKLTVILFLFLISCFFVNEMLFFSLILIVIGTSIFPTYILQRYRLYSIIAINNLLFRLLPLLILFKINSIIQFTLISGIVIISFSSFLLYKFRIFNISNFTWQDFIAYFKEVIKSNRYLSGINIVSIIEINAHNFLAKSLFSINDFADYIYLERYISYLKQGVIYFYDYLFPKVSLTNYKYYLNFTRIIYISYFLFLSVIYYTLTLFEVYDFYGIKLTNLLYVFCLYPLSSLIFNFLGNILFFKYCSDNYSFKIILTSVFLKIILIVSLSPFFSIVTIPIVLIILEIVTGVTRFLLMPKYIRQIVKF
jgi:hypothetical protein